MNPTEQKRFLYINFVTGQINDYAAEIYEALADNDTDGVVDAIASMMSICEELQESMTDENAKD
jgi:hypothetical protein